MDDDICYRPSGDNSNLRDRDCARVSPGAAELEHRKHKSLQRTLLEYLLTDRAF
jgi:hypothetical protein